VRPSAYTFGRRLKDQRERHGVTLETIAATTKISASLLAALERGDVSAWPGGIFRRAFVREYATAIGVAPEPLVAEFAKLFPDQGTVAEIAVVPQPTSELRLTFAGDARAVTMATVARFIVAVVEVSLIVAVSLAVAWVQRVDVWRICAAVALTYYPLTTAFPARSRAFAYVQSAFQNLVKPAPQIAAADVREALHLVMRPASEAPMESTEDFVGAASPLRSASR
jgi:transcriptional regulator with XRE-family HTH domain